MYNIFEEIPRTSDETTVHGNNARNLADLRGARRLENLTLMQGSKVKVNPLTDHSPWFSIGCFHIQNTKGPLIKKI